MSTLSNSALTSVILDVEPPAPRKDNILDVLANDDEVSASESEKYRSPIRSWADYCDSDRSHSRSRSRSRSPARSKNSNGASVSPLRKSRQTSPTPSYSLARGRRVSTAARNGQQTEWKETDIHRMAQRQKLIDYGKNTLAYANYIKNVPREARLRTESLGRCPVTPRKDQMSSKRGFDGQVRVWRKLLHEFWNPDDGKEALKAQDDTADSSPTTEVTIKVKTEVVKTEVVKTEVAKTATVSKSTSKTESQSDDEWDADDEDLEAAFQLAKTIT